MTSFLGYHLSALKKGKNRKNLRGVIIVVILIYISCVPSRYYFMEKKYNDDPNLVSILTANVGNLDIRCRNVLNKLCYKDVEDRIAHNIKILHPDIIALQEVLAPWQCAEKENNTRKVCSDIQHVPQARRLVGNDYSIACNSRNQFECIAVKASVGEIVGCEIGAICNSARTIPEIKGCDNGFTISSVTVKLKNGAHFDVVNFHPQSTNAQCRARMIASVFKASKHSKSLIQSDNVLMMGDFNLDPWRDSDESVLLWKKIFERGWKGRKFQYHSGIVEKKPPYYTSLLFFRKRTLDFVVSNFATGSCVVLGESPSTIRLDGGKGTDHRAIFGTLRLNKD